jgi:hypothetical protein
MRERVKIVTLSGPGDLRAGASALPAAGCECVLVTFLLLLWAAVCNVDPVP